jgi:hypothetical protein
MDLQALAHSCLKPPPNNPGPARPWPMTAHPSAQRVEAAPSVHGVGVSRRGHWTTSGRGHGQHRGGGRGQRQRRGSHGRPWHRGSGSHVDEASNSFLPLWLLNKRGTKEAGAQRVI